MKARIVFQCAIKSPDTLNSSKQSMSNEICGDAKYVPRVLQSNWFILLFSLTITYTVVRHKYSAVAHSLFLYN